MKTSILLLLATVSLAIATATHARADSDGAANRVFGAGVILGEPTGVSLKYWIGDRSAIDGVVGWSFERRHNLYVHAGYLHHVWDLVDVGPNLFAVYFGGGLRYQNISHRSDRCGIRGAAGVAYIFDSIPVDIFFELGPILDFTPNLRPRFGAGIGARYWF
jgi:hypothetical protein